MNSRLFIPAAVALALAGTPALHGQMTFNIVNYSIGEHPTGMAIGDFNGDGMPDIAAVTTNPLSIQMLWNTGGEFSIGKAFMLPANAGAGKLIAGDMNNDGLLDLVVGYPNLEGVAIWQNAGSGILRETMNLVVGSNPHGMALGDINNDGRLDIAVANEASNTVSLLINRGRIGFSTWRLRTGVQPRHVELTDIDRDRRLDIVVSNFGDQTLSVYRNVGRATFVRMQTLSTGKDLPDGLVMFDWNRDGYADLAAVAFDPKGGCAWTYFNDRGKFRSYRIFETSGKGSAGIQSADMNSDGLPDLITADRQTNSLTILLGRADGSFVPLKGALTVGDGPDEVLALDLDGDGDMDLVSMNADGKGLSIVYNITWDKGF
jgi:hypothetical protein